MFQSAFRAKGKSVKGVESGVGMGTDSRLVEGFNWLQQGVVLQDLALIRKANNRAVSLHGASRS